MATYNKFDCFTGDLLGKKHDLANDVFKVMLTNTLPVRTNTIKANITEITAASGYVAGGVTLATTSLTNTAGDTKFVASADNTITAGAAIGPLQYAVMYNDTQTSPAKPLIAWWAYPGGSFTMAIGETLLIDSDQANGLFDIV